MIASMIVAVEEEDMDETTALVVITTTEIEDTVEDVTATMMAHVLTATPEDATIDTSDVVAEEATLIATIEAEIVRVVAPEMHQQPNMVIQLLVQRLGNLMVAATLMRELMLVENFDC